MHCSARGQSPLIFDGNGEYNEELAKAGVLLTAEGIQPSSESARVKFSGNKRIVIDGPFAKTRELLAGYHLVECRDLDEALSIAARIPTLSAGGAIEVRPFASTHENAISAHR